MQVIYLKILITTHAVQSRVTCQEENDTQTHRAKQPYVKYGLLSQRSTAGNKILSPQHLCSYCSCKSPQRQHGRSLGPMQSYVTVYGPFDAKRVKNGDWVVHYDIGKSCIRQWYDGIATVRVTEKFPFRFIGVPFRSYTLCVFSYHFVYRSVRDGFCYFHFEFQLKRSSTAAAAFLFAPRAISVQRQSARTREHSCAAAAIVVSMVSGAFA